LNPVRAGLCANPEDWKYSSYRSLLSERKTKLKRAVVLDWYNGRDGFVEFHKNYKEYQKERDYIFKNESSNCRSPQKVKTKIYSHENYSSLRET